jgi:hypothetical protein
MPTNEERLRAALMLILDSADYMNGACTVTEMVGAVIPPEVLKIAHDALIHTEIKHERH